jgi:hypothetical protein
MKKPQRMKVKIKYEIHQKFDCITTGINELDSIKSLFSSASFASCRLH